MTGSATEGVHAWAGMEGVGLAGWRVYTGLNDLSLDPECARAGAFS